MLYLLTVFFFYACITIAWYYGLIFIYLLKKILLCCVLVLLSVLKFIEHITGGRVAEEEKEDNIQTGESSKISSKSDTKQNKNKTRQRNKKSNEDPIFNTKLSAPIEDIIEETLREDLVESPAPSSDSQEPTKEKLKSKKKRKPVKKVKNANKSDEEEGVGLSFLKEKVSKSWRKGNLKKSGTEHKPCDDNTFDNVGFSFFRVKEKNQKVKNETVIGKQNSDETLASELLQGGGKRTDSSRIPIIDHFKSKDSLSKGSDITQVVLNIPSPFEEKQNFIKPEIKESKKVSSQITYANIVKNQLHNINNIQTSLQEGEVDTLEAGENINANSDLEEHTVGTLFAKKQSQDLLVESEDSVEVICNSDFKGNIEFISPVVELKEHNIQKPITPTQDDLDNCAENKSTSIDVIENNTDQAHIEESCNLDENNSEIESVQSAHFKDQLQHTDGLTTTTKIEFNLEFNENFDTEAVQENNQNIESLVIDDSKNLLTQNNNLSKTEFLVDCLVDKQSPEAHQGVDIDTKTDQSVQLQLNVESGLDTETHIEIESVKKITAHKEFLAEPINVLSKENSLADCLSGYESDTTHKLTSSAVFDTLENQGIEELGSFQRAKRNIPSFENKLDQTPVEANKQIINPVLESKFVKSEELEEKVVEKQIIEIVQRNSERKVEELEQITQQIHIDNQEPVFLNMTQMRVLTINNKEHHESTVLRIEKNSILQFRLGPSLLGRRIKLYCNYPKETNEFDRGTYQLLNWCQDEGCENSDDTALSTQIVVRIAGSFHYYFVYENEQSAERQGSGYFLVDPVLKFGKDETLSLDCIQCQTVLAKQLGPFSTWENKLKVTKESGYNMVHFTPIQELGASKSCYSLSEQLMLNSVFDEENGKKPSFEDVEKLTDMMRKEWKVLSICDIVLNHTANESKWIQDYPEATYNCLNCPYMRPAYLLDAAFHTFSMDVKKGYYEDRGIPPEVSTEDHLNAIRYHFKANVLDPLKIYELFVVDVNKCLEEFLNLARKTPPLDDIEKRSYAELKIIQDPDFRRLKSSVDINLALKMFNTYRLDCFDEESRMKRCAEEFKQKLDSLNEVLMKEITDDLNTAVENVIAGIKYFRVQADGPKIRDITVSNPLVYRYFTDYGSPKSLAEFEEIMYSENGRFLMAHNGWVMNSEPLKNFAAPGTKTYLRRELIAWGDSVKLRYGDSPEDSPFLWNHMRKYVEQTAKIFDGVRLDNCHSTPIPVAEYLLDAARKIKPDLYVVAELFTNSDLTDNIFVNRLGITSLIREAMSAWDSHEQGRLVYRYGGVPVGSFFQPNIRPLVPTVAHALFLDLSHDNPSPVEKRSVFDLLPSTALVNMACCASGSNRGYDELVPHHIHVVDETRQYTEWSEDEALAAGNARFINNKFGIIAAKKALNDLHNKLGKEGFNQVYVDQMDPDIVAVTRHNPETHTTYVLVAFTAFRHPDIEAGNHQRAIKPLKVEGVLDEIVLEASMAHITEKAGGSKFTKFETFIKDPTWINGLSEYQVSLKQHIQINESDILEEVNSGAHNVIQLNFKNFKPGSVVVVKVSLPENTKESISKVRSLIGSFSATKDTEFKQIISRMKLSDLNRALYRCDQEERDEGNGFDVYNIPNFGPVVYCGLQGFMSLLANIRPSNDLGHPFCANLREGNWAIEYIWKRLKVDEGTKELGQWIEENTKCLHNIPRYLIPCYFDVIITGIYVNLLEHSHNLMSCFVKNGSTFVKSLSLGSLQFGGYVQSADLPELSPNLAPPKPPTRKNKNGQIVQACITLSAGLPHFSVGFMRNWGRDTFIALRGLFILTGRFEEARQHILGYAACMRHGLIPNLLDGGRNPRFNCRDSIWWWLYCIKSYCEEAPHGTEILLDNVSRIFPSDDSAPQPAGAVDQPLQDVLQEGLNIHFQGLKFRERNAGRGIDEHMTDAGFNNQIGIHPETGFVFGGNQWNCGTWMDKMGSSDKAGNRGKPATPRDGSAVELVGLSKAAITWLWKLNQEGKYPYDGVERTHKNGTKTKWTFKEWSEKIQINFENKFWIGSKPSSEETRSDLINKKNIYKDSFGASQPWTDYQLRPNFPIAMVSAPELFDPQHAWAALEQAEKYLLGPLGMKTLDPEDWNYRGDYDNSNDSGDFHTAHGFNYHQGPEWVWPVGFFLRAKLIFAAQNGMLKETVSSTKVILSKHFTELQTSPWRGLPELTNSDGNYCRDSSRTQAWSMSCILEVLHDLQQIEKKIIIN